MILKEKIKQYRNCLGIYCLLKDDEIVYIGQSSNIYVRLLEHLVDEIKEFDNFICIENESKTLIEIEEVLLINHFKPIYNKLMANNSFTFLNTLPSICFKDVSKERCLNDKDFLIGLIELKIKEASNEI